MPKPVGLPTDIVVPDVSECGRMPNRRRPLGSATIACPPSCAIVTTVRGERPVGRCSTTTTATVPVTGASQIGGSGSVSTIRSHGSCNDTVSTLLTPPSRPAGLCPWPSASNAVVRAGPSGPVYGSRDRTVGKGVRVGVGGG